MCRGVGSREGGTPDPKGMTSWSGTMKPVHWTLVAMVASLTMAGARGQDATRGANPEAVAEVNEGRRNEANASWWGFDPREATRALQAAIDSGARKVVVENMGTPWIVDEIRLRGDQEIVFESGVIVQAKRGAFKGTNAALFKAVAVKNLTLRGPGATLRMWREDYDDPKQYRKAEWRNVVTLLGCANVRILGLTLAESGGDGIYLGVGRGPNTDILIQDVTCDRNYRQGISVISARGLTIERCVLKNTAGTSPMAGIDFEPNGPGEEIVNCVMRDCLVENNAGDGYLFALPQLDGTSSPVSVRLERCRSVGNRSGIQIVADSRSGGEPVKGEIVALDCEFTGSEQSGLIVGPKPASGCKVRFERCRVVNAAVKHPDQAPILLQSRSGDLEDAGGAVFKNCTIVDPLPRRPIGYHDSAGGRKLVDVSGTLTVEHAGRRETITLDQAQIDAWFPIQAFRRFPPYPGREGPYEPLAPSESRKEWSCNVRQRVKAEWLVWAEAGAEVALTVRIQPVGRSELKAVPVFWIGPSEKATKLGEARETLNASFRAVKTGAHRIVCEPGSATASITESNQPVSMIAPGRGLFHLLGTVGELFFVVPKGVDAFGVLVSGDGPGERVKATLLHPAGTIVGQRDNIDGHQFLIERPSSENTVWSLRLERPSKGVLEDVYVELQGLPPILATGREALLKPAR